MKVKIVLRTQKHKTAKSVHWLIKELVSGVLSGVISGLLVAAAISYATLWIEQHQAFRREVEQLEKVYLGLTQQYIDYTLGMPMVEYNDSYSNTDIAIYKMNNCVVWCAYAKEGM